MPVAMRDVAGNSVDFYTVTMPDGTKSAGHVLVDANGVPYSAAHPLLTAPAIYPIVPIDRGGTIQIAGATALDLPANPARKGGWFKAPLTNTGLIRITLKNVDGTTHADDLVAGDTYSLTLNGYVIQTEIAISGTAADDTFTGVEFQ